MHVPYLCLYTVIITTGTISIGEFIKTSRTLKVLDISTNPIGDKGIEDIAKNLDNSRISELHVSYCIISVTGAKSLAEGLKTNYALKLLNVRHNDITVDGAIAILEAAVANGVCQEVRIDDEYKSDDKVKELMSVLEERKRQEVRSIIT